nr:hypothetical protein [Pseudodesulfovibrio indicus]
MKKGLEGKPSKPLIFMVELDRIEHMAEINEDLPDQSGHKYGKPSFIVDQQNGFSTEESEDVPMPAL